MTPTSNADEFEDQSRSVNAYPLANLLMERPGVFETYGRALAVIGAWLIFGLLCWAAVYEAVAW